MPRPSTSRPAAAGAARHREHVAGGVVRGQLGPRHRPVKTTSRSTPRAAASARSAARYGPPPTISSAASGTRRRIARQRPDQHVLALARHQPGHAHHHRPVGQPVPARGPRSPSTPGETVDVHAGRQPAQRGQPVQRPGEPAAGVLAEVGDHVERRRRCAAAACRRPGSAAQPTSWPWVAPTTAPDPGRRRSAGASSPSGAAAPNHTAVAAVRPGQLARPARATPGSAAAPRSARGPPRTAARRRTSPRPASVEA